MTLLSALQTIFEIALVAAVFWGIFNEHKLIAIEKRIISNIKRRKLRVVKNTSAGYCLNLNHN